MRKILSIMIVLTLMTLSFLSCGKVDPNHVHDFTDWATLSDTECGQICRDCGEIISTKHIFPSEGTVTKEATYIETGTKTYTCTSCGYIKTETIPKLTQPNDELPWDEF